MPLSAAHLAGVGISAGNDIDLSRLAASAGTKALLDAGVTYSDVDHGVACFLDERTRIPRSVFLIFGTEGAPVAEVDTHSGLSVAVQSVKGGQSNCVLVIAIDREEASKGKHKVAAVGLVVISNLFLTSHAYLKDSSVLVRSCLQSSQIVSRSSSAEDGHRTASRLVAKSFRQAQLKPHDVQIVELLASSKSGVHQALKESQIPEPRKASESSVIFPGTTGLAAVCGLIWQLRGWARDRPETQAQNVLHYTSNAEGGASVVILCRSDGRAALKWEEVKDVRDGRERLGYNPAMETRDISHEDLEAVRAREEYTTEDGVRRLQLPTKGGDRAALARL